MQDEEIDYLAVVIPFLHLLYGPHSFQSVAGYASWVNSGSSEYINALESETEMWQGPAGDGFNLGHKPNSYTESGRVGEQSKGLKE